MAQTSPDEFDRQEARKRFEAGLNGKTPVPQRSIIILKDIDSAPFKKFNHAVYSAINATFFLVKAN